MLRRLLRSLRDRLRDQLRGVTRPVTSAPPPAPPPAPAPPATAEAFTRLEAGAQEVLERVGAGEPVTLVDVREPSEWADGHIPGARHIPLGQLEARWAELKACDEIVCYCAAGGRSLRAAQLLRERGLFTATSLEGGIAEWRQLGGPVARG